MNNKIVLVRCQELLDQFECGADREIIGVYDINSPIVTRYLNNKRECYEVYNISKSGACILNKKLSTYEE